MLYLKRKPGQKIVISGGIEIEILSVQGNCVKLGCSSPKDTLILRGEQYRDVTKENISASTGFDSLDIIDNLIK